MNAKTVKMEERHLDALAEISRLCFSSPWTRAGLEAELKSDTAFFLVAEEDGEPAGFAGMHCVCGECYIDLVAVHPERRRGGLGLALVRALADYAREIRASFLTLEVRESNAPARALYALMGFSEEGRRRGFYPDGEDALLLTLRFPDLQDGKNGGK